MLSRITTNADIEFLLSKAENNLLFRARPNEVLDFASRALTEAQRAKDLHAIGRSKMVVGIHALDQCAYQSALVQCGEAHRIFEVSGDRQKSAEAMEYVGRARMLMGQYDQGLEAFVSVLSSETLTNSSRKGILYHALSTLSLQTGDLLSSLEYSQTALNALDSKDRTMSFVLYNIGYILKLNRTESLAADYLSAATKRAEFDILRDTEQPDLGASPFDLKLLGDLYAIDTSFSKAREFYVKAYDLLRQFQFHATETECLIDLGSTSLALYDENTSAEYFTKAHSLATTLRDPRLLAKTDAARSEYFVRAGQYKDAESSLLRVLAYARAHRNHAMEILSFERLAAMEDHRKNLHAASKYYREANDLLKSQWLSSKRLSTRSANFHQGNTSVVSTESYSAVLRSKSEQIGSLQANVAERDGLLLSIRSKLQELAVAHGEQQTVGLRMLVRKLDNHLSTTTREQDLRAELKGLSAALVERLSMEYQSLTPRELEVCSLLVLGFNNEEIEEVLRCSTRTLENHRFRIRRKLSLGHDEKLEVMLKTFLPGAMASSSSLTSLP